MDQLHSIRNNFSMYSHCCHSHIKVFFQHIDSHSENTNYDVLSTEDDMIHRVREIFRLLASLSVITIWAM